MAAAASWAHSIGRSAVVPVTKQQERTGERALGQDSLVEELLYCRFSVGRKCD